MSLWLSEKIDCWFRLLTISFLSAFHLEFALLSEHAVIKT